MVSASEPPTSSSTARIASLQSTLLSCGIFLHRPEAAFWVIESSEAPLFWSEARKCDATPLLSLGQGFGRFALQKEQQNPWVNDATRTGLNVDENSFGNSVNFCQSKLAGKEIYKSVFCAHDFRKKNKSVTVKFLHAYKNHNILHTASQQNKTFFAAALIGCKCILIFLIS